LKLDTSLSAAIRGAQEQGSTVDWLQPYDRNAIV
jgi:hypothetical protein